jgi:hypothetical protein
MVSMVAVAAGRAGVEPRKTLPSMVDGESMNPRITGKKRKDFRSIIEFFEC